MFGFDTCWFAFGVFCGLRDYGAFCLWLLHFIDFRVCYISVCRCFEVILFEYSCIYGFIFPRLFFVGIQHLSCLRVLAFSLCDFCLLVGVLLAFGLLLEYQGVVKLLLYCLFFMLLLCRVILIVVLGLSCVLLVCGLICFCYCVCFVVWLCLFWVFRFLRVLCLFCLVAFGWYLMFASGLVGLLVFL